MIPLVNCCALVVGTCLLMQTSDFRQQYPQQVLLQEVQCAREERLALRGYWYCTSCLMSVMEYISMLVILG